MTDQTAVDPTTALSGASVLTTVGENLLGKWYTLRATIDDLNGQSPWGHDDLGNQFDDNYLKKGATDAPVTNVLDVGETLIRALANLGPQVTEGVKGSADLDDLIAQWFGKP